MKTSFAGSSNGWSFRHAARAAATSGRSCSAACTVFFEADTFPGVEPPHRSVADADAALLQLVADLLQRQVRSHFDPLQKPGPLALQARTVIAAHGLRRHAAGVLPAPNPVDHRADPDPRTPMPPRVATARLQPRRPPASANLPNKAVPCLLASNPSQKLESRSSLKGNPLSDSVSSDLALVAL